MWLRVGDFLGGGFVPLLFLGEIIEELANARIPVRCAAARKNGAIQSPSKRFFAACSGRSVRVNHEGRRTIKPFTSCRRTRGICSPNR